MSFVRKFKTVLPSMITFIIVVFAALFYVMIAVGSNNQILPFFETFLPALAIAFAAIWLQYKEKPLVAHLVLLICAYGQYGGTFFRSLLSYNFDLSRFTATFDAYLIIGFVIFIYLVLYILSCVLTEKMTFQTVKTPIWFLVLLLFVYAYLRYGLSSAIVIALPAILVISMGQSPLAGSILVISVLVSIPFNVLSSLINGTSHFNPFNYWLFSIMGLGLLVYSILGLLQMISTKQE